MPVIRKVVKPDRLDEVLPEADVVFISAPHTTMSHKMMGPHQFELMKKGSYFIAVSRGGIYDLNCLDHSSGESSTRWRWSRRDRSRATAEGQPLWKFSNVIADHAARCRAI